MPDEDQLISRRDVLQAGASGAALVAATAVPILGTGTAAAQSPFARHRIGSKAGDQHLLAYRQAVGVMKERSAKDHTDPLGWTFQGMIHGILTRQSKQDAIDGFFENRPPKDPARLLAEATWDTCPHTGSIKDIRLDFLPWHRIYLYYFEKVVRAASGDKTFALPFWEYSQANRRTIPLAFREPVKGALWRNALYDPRRDPTLNDPTDAGALNLGENWQAALAEPRFEPTMSQKGELQEFGFSLALEIDPHGPIHTLTSGADERGNPNGDMGDTSTAGRDPIFWVHHAAIDWFWARWHAAQKLDNEWIKKQPWANQRWSFADDQGKLVQWTFADFVTKVSDNPGYDSLDDSVKASTGPVIAGGPQPKPAAAAEATVNATSSDDIGLSGRPTTAAVKPVPGLAKGPPPPNQKLSLRVSGVTTDRAVGVVYFVYLNLENPERADEARRVGTISLFGAAGHGTHGGKGGPSPGRTFVFSLNPALSEIARQGSELRVTFVPSVPFTGSPVRIGRIELIGTTP